MATGGCYIGHPNDSSKAQTDTIEDTKVVLLCNYLQVYRDAEDHSQADLFLASVGVFILMPILVALVAALMFSKDSKNICAAACCLWWLPFSVLVFIFNALTPLGKLCSQF